MTRLGLTALLFLSLNLQAQTFVVDAANGPGTNFLDLPAAVAAVPDGAVLLVRPGSYSGALVQSKGLTILGEPGVVVSGRIDIRDSAAHQAVVLSGLEITGCLGVSQIRNCAALVLFEDISYPAVSLCFGTSVPTPYSAQWSSQVALRGCTGGWLVSQDSHVVIERCTLTGQSGWVSVGQVIHATPAVQVMFGSAQITGSTLTGGIASYIYPHESGLDSMSADIRVLAPGTIFAYGGYPPPPAVYCRGGTLAVDPLVTLTSTASPPISSTVPPLITAMPSVFAYSAPLGGTLVGEALGPVGNSVVLVFGFAGSTTTVPGIPQDFWIDPSAFAFLAIGTPAVGVPVTGGVPVPNFAGLLGLRVCWQSATVTSHGLTASNPSVALVR